MNFLTQKIKKSLKKISKKKLQMYFYYIKRYPQAIIKAPLYLILYGPKNFFLKIKKIERKVSPVISLPSDTVFEKADFFFSPPAYIKGIKILLTKGPIKLIDKIKKRIFEKEYRLRINQQYQIWLKQNYPSPLQLSKQTQLAKCFKNQPKISIITPVYNPVKKHLIECIESVLNQSYPHWEFCLVDDVSSQKHVKEILLSYQKKDQRIKVKFRKSNGHICRTSNDALSMATGEFIALLDHDDFLWPNALFEVVKLINEKPDAQFIYSDEDKLDYDGQTHIDPFFKPDWSPDYLRSINYITHFSVLKKSLVEKVGGFRPGTEGAQDWDLFLRATYWLEKNIGHCHPLDKKNPIQHIQTVLYSWRKTRQSTASERHLGKVKKYAFVNQKTVLEDDLKRRGYRGLVEPTKYLSNWRMRYKILDNPLVSIIIPTKDQYQYISKCLNSILKKTTYQNYEVIVIDTGSKDNKVWQLYQKIQKLFNLSKNKTPSIRFFNWRKSFNYASVCNFGATKSNGDYLIFLNNDTEVITPDWIENMLEHAQRKEVGVVGSKLLFPDNTIQHAGVILGIEGGPTGKPTAGHAFRNSLTGDYSTHNVTNYSAVTFACAMTKRELFFKVGMLDENFKIAYSDVDFCLKAFAQKKFIVFQPYSQLYHHESVSVGQIDNNSRNLRLLIKENEEMNRRWQNLVKNDPYFNKNFSHRDEKFNLNI